MNEYKFGCLQETVETIVDDNMKEVSPIGQLCQTVNELNQVVIGWGLIDWMLYDD